MPSFRKPGADERTIALTSDDIEPASIPGRDDSVTRQRPSLHDDEDASMRDRTVPFYNPNEAIDAPTGQVAAANQDFAPPPFPGAAAFLNKPNILPTSTGTGSLTPILPAQVMTSRVENVIADNRESAFAPISRFPPITSRSPASTQPLPPNAAPVASADAGKAPAWVMGYLLLCAALTLIGIVVLFFERQMLGSASPF